MSHPKTHRKITKKAYQVVKPYINDGYFPKYRKIYLFDKALNPDVSDFTKHIRGFDKKNHLNTKEHPQALEKAEKYYDRLVKALSKGKGGAKAASWLSHFIADSLEPAHLFEWKVNGSKKSSLQNLRFHSWLERKAKKLKVELEEFLYSDDDFDLIEYLKAISEEIRKLDIPNIDPLDFDVIPILYENIIIPIQVQTVALAWCQAARRANG
jgi:hypothetical protein